MQLFVNLFCRDIDRQIDFYRSLLGLGELEHSRSPIYRALGDAHFQFGFHAAPAYGLLGLGDRVPPGSILPPVSTYPTFMLADPAAVDEATRQVPALGGRVRKGPYPTYYGQWQAVLEDPEGQVFRLSTASLPVGVSPATPPWES
jgi:catechol 2,3-dioxygenase-like lactoylglutathione lyase family enzyme